MKKFLSTYSKVLFLILSIISSASYAQTSVPQIIDNEIILNILENHNHQKHLKKLLKKLLLQNPEIQSYLFQIEAAKNKVSQAGWISDPKIGVNIMNLPIDNLSLDRTPMSGVDVSLKQNIPFPSKLVTQKKIAKIQLNQTQMLYLEKINQLISKFKQNYFEYAYTQEALYVHYKSRKRLLALRLLLETKLSTNEVPLQDLLKVKVAIGQIDNSVVTLKQLVKIYRARLNTLLFEQVDQKISIPSQKKTNPIPKKLSYLLEMALINRPWMQKLKFEVIEKEKQIDLAKQDLLPDFDFMGSYRFRKNVAGDPVNGEDFVSAGVTINLPFLWTYSKHKNKILENKNLLYSKFNQQKAVSQEIVFQVTQYFQQLKQLQSQISIMHAQILPASSSSFNNSKSSYETGVVDFLDVITSQNSLFTHELSLLRYKYDYEKKRALLEMAVGMYF